MARVYSSGSKASLDKINEFIMLSGQYATYFQGKLVYPNSGTLYILAAIGASAGSKVRNIPGGVDIYTMANADTIYSSPSDSPLASYNYPNGNEVNIVNSSNSPEKGATAGFMGTPPSGFLLQGVGGYATGKDTPVTITINPTATRPYYVHGYFIAISANTSPSLSSVVNLILRTSGGTIIEKVVNIEGAEFQQLKTGTTPIITISSGVNLVIEAYTGSSSVTHYTRVAGVILYKI